MAKQPRIDWLNHGLEFAVVLIGILIAFQLNKCQTNRDHLRLVDQHLSSLAEEAQLNLANLERARENSSRNIETLDSLRGLVFTSEDVATMNALAIDLFALSSAYLRRNAYLTLTETGDIRLISDYDLKAEIVDMYEYYNLVQFVDELASDQYIKYYYPYLQENFDLSGYRPSSLEVYRDLRFRNALGSYRYFLSRQIDVYNNCIERIGEFLTRLDRSSSGE